MSDAGRHMEALLARPPAPGSEAPAWVEALRREATDALRESGWPTARWEAWRHSRPQTVTAVPWRPAPAAAPTGPAPAPLARVGEPLRWVDGRPVPGASHGTATSAAESGWPEAPAGPAIDPKQHPFAALNAALFEDLLRVSIPPEDLQETVHLRIEGSPCEAPTLQLPRILVDAAPGSRSRIVVDFASAGSGPRLTDAVVQVRVGANAQLDLVLLQREADDVAQVCHVAGWQDRDSRLGLHTLVWGGAWVRNDAELVLAGEGAECTLRGLSLGRDQRLVDHHTRVDHAVPHCTSDELYKGLYADRSRGVFRGRVVVRPDAQKSSALQSNPNLLLSRGAEVDTQPQLEIHADDVKASHGSTIGQLDPESIFYLRARGLPEARARALLTRGFAAEIVESLPDPGLAEEVAEHVEAELDRIEDLS